MRKVIAERLVASKGPVPHFYLNIEIDAGPLMAARAELKSGGEGERHREDHGQRFRA